MFLYKTFWDLYKTKYFLYKNRREFRHVFSAFSGFLIRVPDFFAFFFWLFRWESPFLSFTYPFFLSVFLPCRLWSLCFFSISLSFSPYSFDKKSIFSEWTILPDMHLFSFRLGILIFFRMLRQIFLSCLASFSAFFRPLAKNNLLFFHPDHPFSEIFSLRRDNFSCLFPSGTEKFFILFPYFLRFSWIFSKEKSLFSEMNFPSDRIFSPFSGSHFRSIRQEFSPFRLFLHEPDARAPARS